MDLQTVKKVLKYLIWFGLGVIVFSPLYLKTTLFFPFIVTKALAFNISVEIMFLAYLFLVWKDRDYRLKINIVVVLFGAYIALSFISSFFGDNFYRSFWSNNERSEGLLLYMHLFAFLIVLTGFLKKFKDWLLLLDLSFLAGFVVSLVALAQYLNLSFVLPSSGGQRLAGTIGNAGYMAGYLIFAIFFGLFLFVQRKDLRLRIYYGLVMMLEIFIVLYTETRGGWLALAFGVFVFLMYLLFFYFNNKKLKFLGVAIIIVSILSPILLVTYKDSNFVNNNRLLHRAASISMSETTAQNRLLTWGSAYAGFKERPLLGWGLENFYQPFDKYFNPAIYRHAGSVVWFDRAHNIIFDRLVVGGILGLISYLSLLFVPLYYLWSHFIEKTEGNRREWFIPLIFTFLIFSYFIQNLFIFEALVIYIPLFISLAFIGMFTPSYNIKLLQNKKNIALLFIIFAVLFLPVFYFVNIKPVMANARFTKVLSGSGLSVEQKFKLLDEVLDANTHGNQEYRQHYFNFYHGVFRQYIGSQDQNVHRILSEVSTQLEKELNDQISENPYSAMNYLIMMKFNNLAYVYDLNRLNNNMEFYQKAIELAPSRAPIYYEMGYTHLNIGLYARKNNDMDNASLHFDFAENEFKIAIALNDKNPEPYRQLVVSLMAMKRNEKALFYAQEAREKTIYGNTDWADEIIESLSIN